MEATITADSTPSSAIDGAENLYPPPRQIVPGLIILILTAILRIAAAGGDLAIDELWSLELVRVSAHSLIDVFQIRHDNNHILNSMFLYLAGANVPDIVYRIPPVIVSILSVWLAGRIAMRRGGIQAGVIAMIIVGSSYFMILLGTEARGYSYVIFFAYLSWLLLLRTVEHQRWTDAALFSGCASFGFLSHLTFLFCYAGFGIWTLCRFSRDRAYLLLVAHVIPSVTAMCLYLFFVRGMEIGGGPAGSITETLITTFSLIIGGPMLGIGAVIAALVASQLILKGYFHLCRTDAAMAAGFLIIVVLAPAFVIWETRPPFVYPRYFLVPIAFALLLLSDFLSRLGNLGRNGRLAQIGILCLYVAGNSYWTWRIVDHGRGDYSHAIAWMASQTEGRSATVGSDQDFGSRIIFDHYANRLWPEGPPLKYVSRRSADQPATDWWICVHFQQQPPLPDIVTDANGNDYAIQRIFRHGSLTGWDWCIYRKIDGLPRLTAGSRLSRPASHSRTNEP